MPDQVPLWHDSIEDAIGTAVQALGGAKIVAAMLWPVAARAKPETAYFRLKHALNPEKAEKLSPDEVMAIARAAAGIGDHSIMQYLGRELGYQVEPVPPGEAKRRARKQEIASLLARVARLASEED